MSMLRRPSSRTTASTSKPSARTKPRTKPREAIPRCRKAFADDRQLVILDRHREVIAGETSHRQGDPEPTLATFLDIVRRIDVPGDLSRTLDQGARAVETQQKGTVEDKRVVHVSP